MLLDNFPSCKQNLPQTSCSVAFNRLLRGSRLALSNPSLADVKHVFTGWRMTHSNLNFI